MSARLEVHEHCYIRGPRANGPHYKFAHSHEGGERGHQHPNTGPAAYTIDKDEWARATGLKGGGRKRFTVRPAGEQLPLEERQASTFRVVVVGSGRGDIPESRGAGPGVAPIARMSLGLDMDFTVEHVADATGVSHG